MNCCIVVYYAWYTTYNDDYFLGYCADPVLGLSHHEIDVCSEYVHAFMGPAFRGFFLNFFLNNLNSRYLGIFYHLFLSGLGLP